MPQRACNHRTFGRRPACEHDMYASVEAIQIVIGDFRGTIYFVDPNHSRASNQHAGTAPEYPLRTIAAALTKVLPQRGDVIVVGANDGWDYAPGGEGVSTDYALPIREEVTGTPDFSTIFRKVPLPPEICIPPPA